MTLHSHFAICPRYQHHGQQETAFHFGHFISEKSSVQKPKTQRKAGECWKLWTTVEKERKGSREINKIKVESFF